MLSLTPTRRDAEAAEWLGRLRRTPDPASFSGHLRILHDRFHTYATTCPAPLAAAGLVVTPEIRIQCNLYLPLHEIRDCFHLLYHESLTYPPTLSSTPFHSALSWADLYCGLPEQFQFSPDPAVLLGWLLGNQELLRAFLFHSFLPSRFYGGFGRYPGQEGFIGEWLGRVEKGWMGVERPLRCLDAACGTGEDSYGLARQLLQREWQQDSFQIRGWTLEPLEIWSAACGNFPHAPRRTEAFRRETAFLFERSAQDSLQFCAVDLLADASGSGDAPFDLVLCNGLLGGPILNERRNLERVLLRLKGLLAPKGALLIADSFHDGWKRKVPPDGLLRLLEGVGLKVDAAGEGVCASLVGPGTPPG